ncbi:MAG: helix-turn-helix domain-containing protein [Acetatifactor muris]|nr:helix-turn-helix domain-containing protein [Acetatifactor muris]
MDNIKPDTWHIRTAGQGAWLFFCLFPEKGGMPLAGRRTASQELLLLGERIRERRIKLCLSQEALAEKAGISANTVSRIEGGQMSMGIGIFLKLVQALDADANMLLGIIRAGEADGDYRNILHRISHLKKREQEIIMRMAEALADELQRGQ